jgi:CheY-like chemotaxis protein
MQVLEEQQVDLIVLDMRLDDMDSAELIRRIKANPLTEAIPVVMVSANPEVFADQAIADGAQYYMSKPIQPDVIREILEQNAGLDE